MKKNLAIILAILFSNLIVAQDNCPDFKNKNQEVKKYEACIAKHREKYKLEFAESNRSPVKKEDIKYINHFPANHSWWLKAEYTLTPSSKVIEFSTSSGDKKAYKQYAVLKFEYQGQLFTLSVYQSQGLMNNPKYKNYLFMPFTDLTNGDKSYGGGRYIDLDLNDFKGGYILVDFNKCYNPYCAYANGFSCPIPPKENRLQIAVNAGEMDFSKPIKH